VVGGPVAGSPFLSILYEVLKDLQDISAKMFFFYPVHKKYFRNLTSKVGEVNVSLARYD
jgi:hypothetical protein